MAREDWGQPTDPESAARRAGGRRRYNAVRQLIAAERRALVARLALDVVIAANGRSTWGMQTVIAEHLGVHRSTICRDLQHSRELARLFRPCPECGQRTRRG
jgi:hypothetical protein